MEFMPVCFAFTFDVFVIPPLRFGRNSETNQDDFPDDVPVRCNWYRKVPDKMTWADGRAHSSDHLPQRPKDCTAYKR